MDIDAGAGLENSGELFDQLNTAIHSTNNKIPKQILP